jgi:transcriptional antiterminator Rof (Rho-off)
MDALGRVFNVHPLADDVYVSLAGASAVTFIGVNAAGETWTLTEAKDAAATGAQVKACLTRYHVSTTVGAVWAALTQAAASTIVTTASQDVLVVTVEGTQLSDTYKYLKLTSTGSGTVVAVTHDLTVQRKPANLPAIGA